MPVPTVVSGGAAATLAPVVTAAEPEHPPTQADGRIAARQETVTAVAAPGSAVAAPTPDEARRRLIRTVLVLAVILIAVLAVFVLPKLFHVYGP